MEYICQIYKNTENLYQWIIGVQAVRLPLFGCNISPDIIQEGYYCYFQKEDRYSPNLIWVDPPKILTEEQVKIINENWDYCVKNNLFSLEFEL